MLLLCRTNALQYFKNDSNCVCGACVQHADVLPRVWLADLWIAPLRTARGIFPSSSQPVLQIVKEVLGENEYNANMVAEWSGKISERSLAAARECTD